MKIGMVYIAFGLLFFFSACAQSHYIKIDPDLPVSPSTLGNSRVIELSVSDSRPSNIISQWHGTFNIRKFTVSPDSDIRESLFKKIKQGLEMLGFHPKHPGVQSAPSLRVDILQLQSLYQEKIPHMNLRVRSSLRITCKNGKSAIQKTYSDKKDRGNIPPSTFPNENLINASLSSNLQEMFDDRELIDCLLSNPG